MHRYYCISFLDMLQRPEGQKRWRYRRKGRIQPEGENAFW